MSKNSYEYKLQFRKSTAHSNVDALSQFPLTTAPATVPKPPEIVLLMDHLDFPQSVQQRLREKLVITHFYLMYYNLYYMVGQIYVIVVNPSHILVKAAGTVSTGSLSVVRKWIHLTHYITPKNIATTTWHAYGDITYV